MYYVYMLWCRDDTLYTGTASDLCRRMRQHRDGGAACARYTRSHPPRELAGVWRTEGRGEALRLEYAVKRLSRQGKLADARRPMFRPSRSRREPPPESEALCMFMAHLTHTDSPPSLRRGYSILCRGG